MNNNLPVEMDVDKVGTLKPDVAEAALLHRDVQAILELGQYLFQESCLLLVHLTVQDAKLYSKQRLVCSSMPIDSFLWSSFKSVAANGLFQIIPLQLNDTLVLQKTLGIRAENIVISPLTPVPGFNPLYLCLLTDSVDKLDKPFSSQLQTIAKLIETELSKVEQDKQRDSLLKIQELTRIISKAQTEFILEDDRRRAFDILLKDVLALMKSEYGFIGEVLYDDKNAPYLKTFALTNIAWDESTRAFYAAHAPSGLEFRNLNTLFGYTLKTGLHVLTNAPKHHQEAGGIPKGHPPLNAYLGLPVFYNTQLIAMLGIANKASGYCKQDIQFLKPLLTTIGQLVFATRVQSVQVATQEQLNNTVEASQLGIWSLDLNTNELDVNSRWMEMLGYEVNEIKPVTVEWMRQRMHPEDLLRSRTSMLSHINGEQDYYFSQFRIRHKTGRWVWIQARGRLLTCQVTPNQAVKGVLYGVNIDITEQKNIEHRLTKLAEHVPGLVYQFQRLKNGKIIFPYVGPGADKILGFTPEQLQVDGELAFSKVHPEDYPSLLASIDESSRNMQTWKHVFRLSIDGQHYRWLSGQSSPEQIVDGSTLWHGYIQDVTDEVLLQQELKLAKEQAEYAAATKSSFLANMSHEIRTPMNGVIGMLDVMAEANIDPAQTENISLMRDSAYSLLTIIDDILDFSKLEAGKLSLSPVKSQVAGTIDNICNMVDFLALKSDVDFFYYIAPDIPTELLFDPDRLRQILVNLLGNAIKFSSKTERKGQVYLSVLLKERRRDELKVEFKVTDNGIGMSAEVLQGLFLPFTQADGSTSRKYGGTGLGLAISQQLVQLMRGVISVKSEPGNGSEFSVTLPLKAISAEPALEPELRGVSINVLAERGVQLLEHFVCYLQAEGAEINWLTAEDLTRYRAVPLEERKLWLFDSIYSNGNVIRAAELIKQHWPEQSRFLVLGRGRRRKARRTSADTVYIDANVLSKKQFINATKAAYFDLDIESVAVKWLPRHIERLGQFEILVLEDNSTNQKVIRQQLQRMGYHVTVADNGLIGLHQAKQKRFDLILSDLHMPEMDGYQFITQLRAYEAQESLDRTPVIALTANIVQDELTRAKDLGMDDYLVKPLPVEQLKIMLEHYLTSEHDASIQKPSATLFIDDVVSEHAKPEMPEQIEMLDTTSLAQMVGIESVAEILQDYQHSLQQSLILLENAITDHNWPFIKREAHKLKSSSRFIGSESIALCFVELESLCSADNVNLELLTASFLKFKTRSALLITNLSAEIEALQQKYNLP